MKRSKQRRCPEKENNDPKTSLNQHQLLSGEILPHIDINNPSVALKLKKLEKDPFHPKL